jgi:hypothetical protein
MGSRHGWNDARLGRAAVTVAALTAASLAARIPVPGWDAAALPNPGALAIRIAPIISAFVLVEVVALAVPRWRALRHRGPRGRASLTFAAYALAAGLACLQTWGIVTFAESNGALEPGLPRAAAFATIAAGPFLLAAFAAWIDARGLGNGLVLLFGLTSATELVAGVAAVRAVAPENLVQLGVMLALATWLFVRALRRPATPRGAALPTIPVPSCGIGPLALPASVLALPVALVSWFPGVRPVAETFRAGTDAFFAAEAVLALALVPGLTILFNRSGPVLHTLGSTAEDANVALASAARRRAMLRSAVLVVAVLVLGAVVREAAFVRFTVDVHGSVPAIVVAAIMLDVIREWRARGGTAWTAVWPLHRALEAEPTVARLAAAGIPAFARGAGFRTLYQFFAPYAPLVVFVAPQHAESASSLLEAWHAGDA